MITFSESQLVTARVLDGRLVTMRVTADLGDMIAQAFWEWSVYPAPDAYPRMLAANFAIASLLGRAADEAAPRVPRVPSLDETLNRYAGVMAGLAEIEREEAAQGNEAPETATGSATGLGFCNRPRILQPTPQGGASWDLPSIEGHVPHLQLSDSAVILYRWRCSCGRVGRASERIQSARAGAERHLAKAERSKVGNVVVSGDELWSSSSTTGAG